MRPLITLCTFFLVSVLFCSCTPIPLNWSTDLPLDPSTNKISFSGTVAVPGATKTELYNKANSWMFSAFVIPKDGTEFNNYESGLIIRNGVTPIKNEQTTYQFGYTIKLFLKDNKYRYEITNLQYTISGTNAVPAEHMLIHKLNHLKGPMKSSFKKLKELTVVEVNTLKEEIDKSLQASTW